MNLQYAWYNVNNLLNVCVVVRAGRCRPGVCFHLFSQLRFNNMLEFQVPQLLRMPLQVNTHTQNTFSFRDANNLPFAEICWFNMKMGHLWNSCKSNEETFLREGGCWWWRITVDSSVFWYPKNLLCCPWVCTKLNWPYGETGGEANVSFCCSVCQLYTEVYKVLGTKTWVKVQVLSEMWLE